MKTARRRSSGRLALALILVSGWAGSVHAMPMFDASAEVTVTSITGLSTDVVLDFVDSSIFDEFTETTGTATAVTTPSLGDVTQSSAVSGSVTSAPGSAGALLFTDLLFSFENYSASDQTVTMTFDATTTANLTIDSLADETGFAFGGVNVVLVDGIFQETDLFSLESFVDIFDLAAPGTASDPQQLLAQQISFLVPAFGYVDIFFLIDSEGFAEAFPPVTVPVPEPSTLTLLGLGLLGITLRRRKTVYTLDAS